MVFVIYVNITVDVTEGIHITQIKTGKNIGNINIKIDFKMPRWRNLVRRYRLKICRDVSPVWVRFPLEVQNYYPHL